VVTPALIQPSLLTFRTLLERSVYTLFYPTGNTNTDMPLEHRVHLVRVERFEHDFARQPPPAQLRQQLAQTWRDFFPAIGGQQEDGKGRQAPGQEVQKIEAGLITAVEVFEDQYAAGPSKYIQAAPMTNRASKRRYI
jgi:hypothetical protein